MQCAIDVVNWSLESSWRKLFIKRHEMTDPTAFALPPLSHITSLRTSVMFRDVMLTEMRFFTAQICHTLFYLYVFQLYIGCRDFYLEEGRKNLKLTVFSMQYQRSLLGNQSSTIEDEGCYQEQSISSIASLHYSEKWNWILENLIPDQELLDTSSWIWWWWGMMVLEWKNKTRDREKCLKMGG